MRRRLIRSSATTTERAESVENGALRLEQRAAVPVAEVEARGEAEVGVVEEAGAEEGAVSRVV